MHQRELLGACDNQCKRVGNKLIAGHAAAELMVTWPVYCMQLYLAENS